MLSEMFRDWLKIPHHGLSTEPRRGAEVWSSFRPAELQNAERLLWDVSAMTLPGLPPL